jgi:hypothetical protein
VKLRKKGRSNGAGAVSGLVTCGQYHMGEARHPLEVRGDRGRCPEHAVGLKPLPGVVFVAAHLLGTTLDPGACVAPAKWRMGKALQGRAAEAMCTPFRRIGNPFVGGKPVEICGFRMKRVDSGQLVGPTQVAGGGVAGSREPPRFAGPSRDGAIKCPFGSPGTGLDGVDSVRGRVA